MKISYNWLSEYLPTGFGVSEIADILNSTGFEVEKTERFGYNEQADNLNKTKGVIIGEIITVNKLPNSNHLKLVEVKFNNKDTTSVICGADNVLVNNKVALATIGSVLHPYVGKPVSIDKAIIEGFESSGMLCSAFELGISNEHEGLYIFPDDTPIGTEIADYFQSYNDIVLDLGLTPNRSDAMSHFGVARDIRAFLCHHNKAAKTPFSFNETFDNIASTPIPGFQISIENPELCPRYCGILIHGVKVKPSPKWLKDKLEAIGVRSINNIVDITNYLLFDLGQPLHAYDFNKIKGGGIKVKQSNAGEVFIGIDTKKYSLNGTETIIYDFENNPLCIAGVYGGKDSSVTENTTAVFLECASFSPTSVRSASLFHGLRTDAASRFEKGTDISVLKEVLYKSSILILDLAGGNISHSPFDVYPIPRKKLEIELYLPYVIKLSGKEFSMFQVTSLLSSLGYEIVDQTDNKLIVAVPFNKVECKYPADIVDDILRIDGLNNIAIPQNIHYSFAQKHTMYGHNAKDRLSQHLVSLGFNEILTNSITNSQYYSPDTLKSSVFMLNSLTTDLNVMRPSMLESGLEVIQHNINRKKSDLRLFDFGNTYSIDEMGNYVERKNLALFFTGKSKEDSWHKITAVDGFFHAKGILENLLGYCCIHNYNFSQDTLNKNSFIAYYNNKRILSLIKVDNKKLATFGIKQEVFFAEVDFSYLLSITESYKPIFKEIPKYPSVQRDLSIVVSKKIKYEEIVEKVFSLNIKNLKGTNLFDIFEDEKIGKENKSLAINFTFMDEERTLTDEEIEKNMNDIKTILFNSLAAKIRS